MTEYTCRVCGRPVWREVAGQWLHWWAGPLDARMAAPHPPVVDQVRPAWVARALAHELPAKEYAR